MIRRDTDNLWLLISQLEHARIAAELAEAWNDPELVDFPRRSELLSAIRHHDDGWADWELAPTINEAGEPRDFTEMPMAVASRIWGRSIQTCADQTAFGGLWVSRHFCHLAEHALETRDTAEDLDALKAFLFQQASIQEQWREKLAATTGDFSSCEERGYLWLQNFDRISLWLCCAERTESWNVVLPSGCEATFLPLESGEIVVDPFPFDGPVTLTVEAASLARQKFQDEEQLSLGQLPRHTIEWRLIPKPD